MWPVVLGRWNCRSMGMTEFTSRVIDALGWLERGFVHCAHLLERLAEDLSLATDPALADNLRKVLAYRQAALPVDPLDIEGISLGDGMEGAEASAFEKWFYTASSFDQHLRAAGNQILVAYRRRARHGAVPRAPLLPPEGGAAHLKADNRRINDAEILERRATLSSWPRKLVVDPSNDCNLRCRTCSQSVDQGFFHSEMNSAIKAALADALPYAEVVNYYGTGEPLLSVELQGLLDLGAQHGVMVDLLTNGTILDHPGLDLSRVARIGISMDGATARTFEAIRFGANFSKVVTNVRNLRAAAPDIEIYFNATICRANLHEISALMELARDLGVDKVQYGVINPYGERHQMLGLTQDDLPVLQEQYVQVLDVIRRRGGELAWSIPLTLPPSPPDARRPGRDELLTLIESLPTAGGPAGLAEGTLPFDWELPPMPATLLERIRTSLAKVSPTPSLSNRMVIPHCLAPWRFAFIESDGRVRPCCVLDLYMGDLNHGDFLQVWNGPRYRRLREGLLTGKGLPEKCRICQDGQRYEMSTSLFAAMDAQGITFADLVLPAAYSPTPHVLGALFHELRIVERLWEASPESSRAVVAELEAFLRQQPDSAERNYYLALLLAQSSPPLDALHLLDKAEVGGDRPAFRYHRARLHYLAGQVREADQLVRAALLDFPGDAGLTQLVETLRQPLLFDQVARAVEEGNPERRTALLDELLPLLKAEPEGDAVWFHIGLALGSLPDREAEAIEAFDRSLAMEPGRPFTLYHKARILMGIGQSGQAVPLLEQALALAPGHSSIENLLATCRRTDLFSAVAALLDSTPDLARSTAQHLADQLAREEPDAAVSYHLGLALGFLPGKEEDALAAFAASLKAVPDQPFAYYHSARVLIGLGRRTEALSLAEQAFEMLPDHDGIRRLRDQCARRHDLFRKDPMPRAC